MTKTSMSVNQMMTELRDIKKQFGNVTVWVENWGVEPMLSKIKFFEIGNRGDESGVIMKTGHIEEV